MKKDHLLKKVEMKNEEKSMKVAIIDDDEADFFLARSLLLENEYLNYEVDWESDFESGLDEVKKQLHDVYLIDYRLGAETGLDLIVKALTSSCTKPMILLTGQGDFNAERKAIQDGAADYLKKGEITASMLDRSIRYAIDRKAIEQEKNELITELKRALDEVKTLKGLIPICSGCKKIRDDEGYWNQIDSYIEKNSEAEFSHGLCPECSDEMYGDQEWYKKAKREGRYSS